MSGPPLSPDALLVPNGGDRYRERVQWEGSWRVKVSGQDNGGSLAVFRTLRTGPAGPVFHLHREQDEWFFVEEGEFVFRVGERTFRAGEGDWVFGPRMVPHGLVSTSATSRLTIIYQPAGTIEEFYREAGAAPRPPALADINRLCRKHGMDVLGPPLVAE